MSGFLTDKNVFIRSVSRVREGTRGLLKAEFEMTPFQKGSMSRVGWFTVSPSEAWVLHEYKFDHGDISRHGSIEYGEMQAGVPVLRRFTCTARRLGKLLNTQTYDFEKLEFVDVPDRDFTLAAFDLPEVGRPAAKPLWVVRVLANCLFVIGPGGSGGLQGGRIPRQRKKVEGTGV